MEKNELNELYEKLEQVIVESNLPYATVMNALSWLGRNYSIKGKNLLNAANIQEVSKMRD